MVIPRVSLAKEEIEDARSLSESQRLEMGGDLFDDACEVTLSGIRSENPGVSENDAINILRQRLELAERLEIPL